MSNFIRPTLAAVAAIGLLASPALAEEDQADANAEEMTKGEKKLAKILEGRVAGEPQNCIRLHPNERVRVIDDTAIVYGRGRTIYVNETRRPQDLDNDDVMVVRRFGGTQFCRQDIVTTLERGSGFYNGNIFLSEFVPYTRVEEDSTTGS